MLLLRHLIAQGTALVSLPQGALAALPVHALLDCAVLQVHDRTQSGGFEVIQFKRRL